MENMVGQCLLYTALLALPWMKDSKNRRIRRG